MSAKSLVPFLVALFAAKLALDHFYDPDLFWQIRLGLDILARRALPRAMEHTWTLGGTPCEPNDFLGQILFGAVYELGGYRALAVLKALLVTALGLVLYRVALRRAGGNALAAGLATAFGMVVAAAGFAMRPLLLGFLLLTVLLLLIERIRAGGRWEIAAMPALSAAWLNAHGSWPVGLAALGAALLDALWAWRHGAAPADLARRLGAAAALFGLGLAANFIGPGAYARPFATVNRSRELGLVEEWSPVPWSDPLAWLLVGLAIAAALSIYRRGPAKAPFEAALLALALAMAFKAARHLFIFGVLAAPIAAGGLAALLKANGLAHRKLNAAVAALAALSLGGVGLFKLSQVEDEIGRRVPVAVIGELERAGLAGQRGFAYFDWAGYLVLRKIPTFVDGRFEPFDKAGLFDAYVELERRGDVEALEAQGVRWILARRGNPLDDAAPRRGWELLAEDAMARLWVRGERAP